MPDKHHAVKSVNEVKDYYDVERRVETYIGDRFTSPLLRLLHDTQVAAVNEVIRRERIADVLEVAPGPARVSAEVRGFRRGVMVDTSGKMLNVASRRLEDAGVGELWELKQGDVFRLDLGRTFDLIFSFRLIRHFESADRSRIYQRLRRHLDDGGLLMFDAVNYDVSFPLRKASPDDFEVYDELYKKADLVSELREHGFDPVRFISVQCRYGIQNTLNRYAKSSYARFGISFLLAKLISLFEDPDAPNPLEWIVVCRKTRHG